MRRSTSASLLLCALIVLFSTFLVAQNPTFLSTLKGGVNSATVLVAQVVNPLVPADDTGGGSGGSGESGGGGGGGGAGGAPSGAPAEAPGAQVTFSGHTAPSSTVILLKDAAIARSVTADKDGKFELTLINVAAGSFIFSLYSTDQKSTRTSSLSFPLSVSLGGFTTMDGLLLSPTLTTDKLQVKKGDTIKFSGTSVPSSNITLVFSPKFADVVHIGTNQSGAYSYTLTTSNLDKGRFSAKVKTVVGADESSYSPVIAFTIGESSVKNNEQEGCSTTGDLKCDGRVNITDFSVMVYWFKRPLTEAGSKADLNHDGKVDLIDFSIMASHWTG